jgi:alkyl hydroperoxide reductase subunit AhpF
LLEREEAVKYSIDRVPAIAVLGPLDYGIRFFGIPSGYEIMSLLDAILLVSKGDSGLTPDSRARLAGIESPLTLQVFVTPT